MSIYYQSNLFRGHLKFTRIIAHCCVLLFFLISFEFACKGLSYELDNNKTTKTDFIFFDDGKRKEEIPWLNGKIHGDWISWYHNGIMESHYIYTNGVKNGKWQWWNENGKLREEYNWKDGKRNGEQIEWYENGQKMMLINYLEDVKHGEEIQWYNNGNIKSKVTFNHGKMNGKYYQWYLNGKKSEEGEFNNGKREGKWFRWYENGKLSEESNYKNGLEQGKFSSWHENGKLESRTIYENGKICGEAVRFYSNGKNEYCVTYQNSKIHGLEIYWFENGQKASETRYINGKKHGKSIEWDEEGNIEIESKWMQGKLVEENGVKLKSSEQSKSLMTSGFLPKKNQERHNKSSFCDTAHYNFLPIEISLGKPIPQYLKKSKEIELLIFFSNEFLHQYSWSYKGHEFIITSKLPFDDSEEEIINDIICKSASFISPEGISIGDPLKYVLRVPGAKVQVMNGFGYWVKLPSGWNAIFYQGEEVTKGKLNENEKVRLIALSLNL